MKGEVYTYVHVGGEIQNSEEKDTEVGGKMGRGTFKKKDREGQEEGETRKG